MLSSVVGEGGFLQETVPLVTREEVFAGQAAQEEEGSPGGGFVLGRSEARCSVTPPSAGHPAPAGGWETWVLGAGSDRATLRFWQDTESEGACPG